MSRQVVPDANEVSRRPLLQRLGRVRPAILAMIAPAGYGKSAVMRQYLTLVGPSTVCDCRTLRSDLDLARRVVSALRAFRPGDHRLKDREELLGDGGISIAERIDLALGVWEDAEPGAFVFENAEGIFDSPAAHELFTRLLTNRPADRSIVICSRSNLRAHLTRFAAPHEIVVLRAQDLAFDLDELREVFDERVDAATLERVAALTRGWPVAALLMKRFATEGRIVPLIDRLDDLAFGELHDYIDDEIAPAWSVPLANALFACAVIPSARIGEIEAAEGNAATEALTAYVRESPFITRSSDGTFAVHALLASWMLRHREDRRLKVLRRVAERCEREAEYERAAELFLACDDRASAARALGAHEVLRDTAPSPLYARVLRSLDRASIARYPRLWAISVLLRLFCVETATLLDEAESMSRTLSTSVSSIERYHVMLLRAVLCANLGALEEALAAVDEIGAAAAAEAEGPVPIASYVAYVQSILLARLGRYRQAERGIGASLEMVEQTSIVASSTLLALGANIARAQGERAVEVHFIDRAIDRARESRLENFVGLGIAESVIGSWIAGDNERYIRDAAALQANVERAGTRAFHFLSQVANGRVAQPVAADLHKYVAFGWLMVAANASDAAQAQSSARLALRAAQHSNMPFVQTLAAIAMALLDETGADEYFTLATAAAQKCEAPILHRAIESIVRRDNDAGMLQQFVLRFSRDRAAREAPLRIDVMSGTVLVSGQPVALSDRGLELLVALTLRREPTPRSRLAAMLWPDVEEDGARNALSVCLHRLRNHLGRDDLVVRDGEGYRLHAGAFVDVWEIDRVVAIQRLREPLGEADRTALRRVWTTLREELPERVSRWEWFAPTQRRLRELRVEVAQRLGLDALDRADTREALEYANDVIAYDPCDEPARELAIRAHLISGDRSAAMRQYRQYRETLLAELQCEPSASLAALVLER